MWRERDVRKKRCQENLKCLGLLGLLCWNQRSAGEPRHAVCLAARPAPSGRVFPAVLQERALLETSPARCCACSTCSQTMQMQKCKRHVMTKCFNFRQYASCILFARRWPDGGKDTGSCPVLVWRMASTCGGASLWTTSSGCWKLVKWKNQTICSMSLASSCRALARCSCA